MTDSKPKQKSGWGSWLVLAVLVGLLGLAIAVLYVGWQPGAYATASGWRFGLAADDATAGRLRPLWRDKEAAMDNTGTSTPGTLAKFHLGLAADGTSCAMVFIDDQQHSIACIAGFADLE